MVKKCEEFGFIFRLQMHLRRFGFKTEQDIGSLKHALGARVIGLYTESDISPTRP